MSNEQIAVAKQTVIAEITDLEAAAKANGSEIAVYVGITKQVVEYEDLRTRYRSRAAFRLFGFFSCMRFFF